MNPLFRVCKYSPGQFFKAHYDVVCNIEFNIASRLSVLIYLNQDFEGGRTNFLDGNNKHGPTKISYSVQPKIGTGVFFEHDTLHEGEILSKGQKYILRTDIMYYRPGKGKPLQ